MYHEHFGLRESPFQLTPDTGFFFNHRWHREAMEVLRLTLAEGEGFLKVTGEVGTGKTLLCRMLLTGLGEAFTTVYIHNPQLEPEALYLAIADELGLRLRVTMLPNRVLNSITRRLIKLADQGQRVVLLVDEAQAMPSATLEALRLITNLETEKRKLLQVVLFGQSELNDRLADPAHRQIRQRITFSYHLQSMDRDGVAGYVAHRLAVAGYNGPPLFKPSASRALYKATGGIPRLVNTLANKSLMAAYGKGSGVVTATHVRAARRDSLEQLSAVRVARPGWLRLPLALAGVLGAIGIVALLGMFAGAPLLRQLGAWFA